MVGVINNYENLLIQPHKHWFYLASSLPNLAESYVQYLQLDSVWLCSKQFRLVGRGGKIKLDAMSIVVDTTASLHKCVYSTYLLP